MRWIEAFGREVCAHKRMTIVVVALLVLFAIVEDLFTGEVLKIDVVAYRTIVEGMRADWLTPYMEQFSSLASPVVLFVMCLVITAFAPGKQPGRCALLNLALTLVLNVLLKNLIQRPRPEGLRLIAETGYSFPSGHSMVSMAFYGLMLWMVWHYEKDKVLRFVLCALFALTILMVGVSRIYLGVHYASDVVAGFAVSLLWLAFYTKTIVPLFMGAGHGGKERMDAGQGKA